MPADRCRAATAVASLAAALGCAATAAPARAADDASLARAAPPPASEATWTGEFDFGLSLSRSDYATRRVTIDTELTRRSVARETVVEGSLDREWVLVRGEPTELDRDRFDVNVKHRRFLWDSGTFVYVSPRVRHNSNGYYTDAAALRGGVGQRWWLGDERSANLEFGSGLRRARVFDGSTVDEVLLTLAASLRWALSPTVALRLAAVNEQSGQERYRTLDASVRSRLGSGLVLSVKASYARAFPFSSLERTGEASLETSLGLEF